MRLSWLAWPRRLRWPLHWFIDETVHLREGNPTQGRELTYSALELGSNNFPVALVSCLGFFTSSYLLFANTTTLPMLGFVYWHDDAASSHEADFNNATLAGTIVGMIMFGLAADRFGRRKLYGYEILLLMLGTMGVVMSSAGYIPFDQANGRDPGSIDYSLFGSMDFNRWLLFWRFCSGVGIGGEYPLTAVIAAEFAPTSTRPRMLATVFAMQSLGVTVAAIVSLVVTVRMESNFPYDPTQPLASAPAIDASWRWVMGVAFVPGIATAIMRWTLPESPRYTLDVENDPLKAFADTLKLKGLQSGSELINTSANHGDRSGHGLSDYGLSLSAYRSGDEEGGQRCPRSSGQDIGANVQPLTVKRFFWTQGNWRALFATASIWFLDDFAIFSIGLNEAPTLSKFWFGSTGIVGGLPNWDADTADPKASIYEILKGNSIHIFAIECTALLAGSLFLILFITRINRRLLTWVMFLVTGTLLILTGVTLLKTANTSVWGISTLFYALCKFAKAFGIGPLTFILPAELFPTRYRASCHGLSAGLGKLGSVVAGQLLARMTFGEGAVVVTSPAAPIASLGYVLVWFAAALFLAAFISWFYVPDLQHNSGESKTLEELADGRQVAVPSKHGLWQRARRMLGRDTSADGRLVAVRSNQGLWQRARRKLSRDTSEERCVEVSPLSDTLPGNSARIDTLPAKSARIVRSGMVST